MHTFGDGYANYFYGRNPRQMSISGILIDDLVNDWFYKFLIAYDKFLRGTSLARNYRLIRLTLPNVVLVGTILDLSYTQDASNDANISFSMNFVIKSMSFISSNQTVQNPNKLNSIFKLNPTSRDFATLTSAEIQRRTSSAAASTLYQFGLSQGVEQSLFQRFSSGNTFDVLSSERAQSLFSAFSNNAAFGQLTKLYEKTKSAALTALAPVLSFIKKVTTGLEKLADFFRNIVS